MQEWQSNYGESFHRQLKFEAAQHKELSFFYEQLQEELDHSFTVEAVDFYRDKESERLQKRGVDTILHFANGKKLYVQEKHIRNKNTVYLEYEKPNGSNSWALDSTELSHMLVFHFTEYNRSIRVLTKELVKLVGELLPIWKVKYSEGLAIHSGYKGIKIPIEELMKYKERLKLKEYVGERGWLEKLLNVQ